MTTEEPQAVGAEAVETTALGESATEPTGATKGESDAPAAATATSETTIADDQTQRITELERELDKEREQGTEYMRRWQSAQADLANLRRRMQQEQEQRDRLLTWNALAPVVTALDSLERAFLSLPPTLHGYSWIDGIALVDLQLRRALEAQGIRPLHTEPGQNFDPQRHQAIGEVETTEHGEGLIAVVIQQGYEAGPMLLRPALVQVARAPKAETAASEADQANSAGEATGVSGGAALGPEGPEHATDGA